MTAAWDWPEVAALALVCAWCVALLVGLYRDVGHISEGGE